MWFIHNKFLDKKLLAINPNIVGKALIFLNSIQYEDINYYRVLGLHPKSTQRDIKAAYYQLSMQYHPDKNQGSKNAAKKFLQITQAYEILSNYRTRKLYDKGIISSAGAQYSHSAATVDELVDLHDDDETKFYKSRFRKSTIVDVKGRTPIYNFDEWARAHYGHTFNQRQKTKQKYEYNEAKVKEHKMMSENTYLIYGALVAFIMVYSFYSAESSYDVPKENTPETTEQK